MHNTDFESKDAILKAFPDEVSCLNHLEKLRWDGFVTSPFDPLSKVYACSGNKYRCRKSGKYFNAKTGTIFYNSKIPLQTWFLAIWIVTRREPKITSVALGKELNLTQKSAWYVMQRIRFLNAADAETFVKEPTAEEIAAIEVITDQDKLPMSQWLELLKK